jgi:CheY-like chemotaxis protein
MRVLVVDDDPLVRQLMAENLAESGYDVTEAVDAHDAILRWREEDAVSLVVTDVRMPGQLDGFGLARWLKDRSPETKVLVVSGFANTEDSGSRPYDAFLDKPFTSRRFQNAVQRLIGGPPEVA